MISRRSTSFDCVVIHSSGAIGAMVTGDLAAAGSAEVACGSLGASVAAPATAAGRVRGSGKCFGAAWWVPALVWAVEPVPGMSAGGTGARSRHTER
jgi:hypothetical protein